jgi:phage gp29-like protein
MNEPKISAERVKLAIQNRFAPIRQITPETLGRQLDDFRCGRLDVIRLWDALRLRDDILTSVCAKRLDAVAGLRWEVLIDEDRAQDNEAEALRHQEILQGFYSGVECTSVLDQDMAGGVGLLSRYLLQARFDKYSVLEWMWRPRTGVRSMTTASFSACPGWWFESRTGRLRYLPVDYAYEGQPMDPLGWLVAVAPHHLMEACSVAWMYKTLPLRDWLNFCDKFGTPGLLGKTDASPGSPEWEALKEAVQAYGQDFAAVVNRSAEITTVDVSSTGQLPHPPLVEAMNRSMSALIRGADLSTMSAGAGSGQGASLQGDEKEAIGEGDANFVSEILQRKVDRALIGYELGAGVEPLAYIRIIPKTTQNIDTDLKVDDFLIRNKVPLGEDALRSRYGRPAPREDEEVVGGGTAEEPAADPAAPAAGNPEANPMPDPEDDPEEDPAPSPDARIADLADLANAANATGEERLRDAAVEELAIAMKAWLAPIRVRLAEIANQSDALSQRSSIESLRQELPRFLRERGSGPDVVAAFEGTLGASLVNGLLSVPGERATLAKR